MSKHLLNGLVAVLSLSLAGASAAAEEGTQGKRPHEANKERLVLDDMVDVTDWYNGSPEETEISSSDEHADGGKRSLKFANLVDHTKGEKNYPIGWPRAGKDMARGGISDWSEYDFFECRIYADASRERLPGTPLGVGFYHTGPKRSSSFPLKDVRKDQWTEIVIPISELIAPADVQRVQFNISESDYQHGDRVDFYISDVALTRFVHPVVAELALDRKLLYSGDRQITALYTLMGRKGLDEVTVDFEIGRDGKPAARARGKASRHGELPLRIAAPLTPGTYSATLRLRDAAGQPVDQSQVEFRVIEGPF
ncbi:MAG TPA: hypothetical protein VMY37_28175 [Thermoguttaceae bacterium]|nr:hypothetical protein [Thermoguttaceae bacterium]